MNFQNIAMRYCQWFKPRWFGESCYKIFSQNFALKTKKSLKFKDFCNFSEVLATPKWCYASHSDVAPCGRSDVMYFWTRAKGTLHIQRKHHAGRAHHVPLAEHIVEKSLTQNALGFFLCLEVKMTTHLEKWSSKAFFIAK